MDRFMISQLRRYYGALLTERQNDMLRLRYDDDMSYGEIAEELDVSRQAVLDGINKGEKHLEKFESALRLVERDASIEELLAHIVRSARSGDEESVIVAADRIKTILEE